MSRRCRNDRTSKRRANTKVAGVQIFQRAGARRAHTSQYQHVIPRFILQKFQLGIPKSRKERDKEFERTRVDSECILYYDVATGSLDTRPIGKVYGVLGIYQDVHNTRNINELEHKLAHLESEAASIINNLHEALPWGALALKCSSLELLQKFLFLMHFRTRSHSSRAFEVDRPENIQAHQWVERILEADSTRSADDIWRHTLRYYLDSSHSELMRDAAYAVESGEEDLPEHIPSIAYRTYLDDYFLSIWEAAQGEEFILTHNAFGLSEGSATGCPALHRIFVLSPRIAVVLCNVRLRPETKRRRRSGSLESSLLDVNLTLPVPNYTAEERGIQLFSHQRSSWEMKIDSVVFKITKLTRSQTLELNSVVLFNLEETGSLTFRSATKMLRTAHAFRSNFPSSHLVIPLIAHLTTSLQSEEVSSLHSSVTSSAASPDEDFDPLSLGDLVLYVLLMQICSGRKQSPSAYDRAHFVLKIMAKAKAKPTSFARKISRKVRRAFRACKGDMEDGMSFAEGVNPAPLLSSIPSKLSSQLFELMIPYMHKRGVKMSGGGETLKVLQRDVAVVSFLQHASCNPGVWHALSHSSSEAPEILSRLFKKGTPADEFIAKFSPSKFSSHYNRAYSLRKVYGMAGPTTSPISQRYYGLTAFIIEYFDHLAVLGFPPEPYFSQSCKRSNAQLVHIMPRAHSDLLMKWMKKFLRAELEEYEYELGEDTLDETTKEWVDEMAIVGCLAWLGKHRRNMVDFILDGFPLGMNLELFEGESHWEYLN
ncbi:uncharacterized protein HD556DRAFT_1447363 [Suillus plorans]|uniref:Uncharacterized protein n=1 Tax=Suillus plorans TaxID=116603 RepID=A0A9P7AGR0_9AGAM|nr:uncharacterized protein HD556DRAFT_1447363 [Suillus plorans]KAG1789081.1 hypothetical protein HD556DRAFT_1447363 [Suillus plorans]